MKTRNIIVLMVLLVAGYFGYRTYQYRTDPLIAGIPPLENADGTVDYTLIGKPYDRADRKKGLLAKWVLRFPKEFQIVVSKPGSATLVGSDSPLFKFRYNEFLGTHLYYKDFRPFPRGKAFTQISEAAIHFHVSADNYSIIEAQDSLTNWCDPTGRKFGNLIEFKSPIGQKYNRCRLSARTTARLLVLKGPREVLASFDCEEQTNICHYQIKSNTRTITGSVGYNHRDEFEQFYHRMNDLLSKATVENITLEPSAIRGHSK